MISFVNILLIIFWLGIIPFLLGSFIESGYVARCQITYNKMISRTMVFGVAFMLTVFQIIAVPFIWLGLSFSLLANLWTAIITVCSTVSACALFYNRRNNVRASIQKQPDNSKNIRKSRRSYRFRNKFRSFFKGNDREALVVWALALIMIALQITLLVFRRHIDTDDSRFIAETLEAWEKDSLLRIHPITGAALDFPIGEMLKELTAPYPIFIAVIARLTMVHPTIVAHTLFPILLIPLSYCSMYVIGRYFFDDKRSSGVYMLVLSLIVMFSFESMFSIGYTLLAISWQGRSAHMVAFLPLAVYLYIQIYTEGVRNKYIYLVLLLMNFAAANLSGTANILSIGLGGTYALCELVVNKKLKSAVMIGLTLIPSAVYYAIWML